MKIYCNRDTTNLIEKLAGTGLWVRCKDRRSQDEFIMITDVVDSKTCHFLLPSEWVPFTEEYLNKLLNSKPFEGKILSEDTIYSGYCPYKIVQPLDTYTSEEMLAAMDGRCYRAFLV